MLFIIYLTHVIFVQLEATEGMVMYIGNNACDYIVQAHMLNLRSEEHPTHKFATHKQSSKYEERSTWIYGQILP